MGQSPNVAMPIACRVQYSVIRDTSLVMVCTVHELSKSALRLPLARPIAERLKVISSQVSDDGGKGREAPRIVHWHSMRVYRWGCLSWMLVRL